MTREDHWHLVFDTDTKRLYVEHRLAQSQRDGTAEHRAETMDIAEYLSQGGQTAGHRQLWRLLRAMFEDGADVSESSGEAAPADA
jgi:hypothetical protein